VTLTAALLLLASAILHASWNLLSKQEHPTAAFFLLANTIGCLLLLPALALYPHVLGAFSAPVWVLVGLTGFFQMAYFAGLAGAYRTGDLSTAYPLVRSLPVVAVPVVTLLLRQGRPVSGQFVLGAVLVVGGCLLLPMRHLADLRLAVHWRRSSLFALLAGCGTTGYSIVDDMALRRLRAALGAPAAHLEVALVYALIEGLSASLWLLLPVLAQRKERDSLRAAVGRLRQAALTGAGLYLAYTLLLIAMGFVQNVSYVVAFRQLSILFGTLMGVLVLKEPRTVPKFVGAAVLMAGLVVAGTA
jgi:drug/metabolite transporter (DMT)-like permease